ncbi:MAG: hypothetical protein JRM80_08170 [Nitrososphaerota archaeon]|nr:hypothetical protein [Nitrososphaerota archaeon]
MNVSNVTASRRAIGASTVILLFIITALAVTLAYNYTSMSNQISALNASLASDNNDIAAQTSIIQQLCGGLAPGASQSEYCPHAPPASFPAGTILLYRTMPKQFTVGNFTFYMEYNGTGYGGTPTLQSAFSLVLNVSSRSFGNQSVIFRWAPPAPASGSLPSPSVAEVNNRLELQWFANQTGTYLNVNTG